MSSGDEPPSRSSLSEHISLAGSAYWVCAVSLYPWHAGNERSAQVSPWELTHGMTDLRGLEACDADQYRNTGEE